VYRLSFWHPCSGRHCSLAYGCRLRAQLSYANSGSTQYIKTDRDQAWPQLLLTDPWQRFISGIVYEWWIGIDVEGTRPQRNLIYNSRWRTLTAAAVRSKACVCGRSLATIPGSNPARGMVVCLSWLLSRRGLCDRLITRPEESYRVWYECDHEGSIMRRRWPTKDCCAIKKSGERE
jgi:hypothetical protein